VSLTFEPNIFAPAQDNDSDILELMTAGIWKITSILHHMNILEDILSTEEIECALNAISSQAVTPVMVKDSFHLDRMEHGKTSSVGPDALSRDVWHSH
jgi:hypothetical protein